MNLRIRAIAFVGATMTMQASGPVLAQSSSDFSIATIHVDHTTAPKSVPQTMAECKESPVCNAALEAIQKATGVPVSSAASVVAALSEGKSGEGTYVQVRAPAGFKYCGARMTTTSIVPKDGPRGSTFLGQVRADHFYFETWTPQENLFGGRTWVDGKISLLYVRDGAWNRAVSTGACRPSTQRTIWYCRGGGCQNRVFEDAGQSLHTASPPGANSAH